MPYNCEEKLVHIWYRQILQIERYVPTLHNFAHLEAAAETRRHLKGIELSKFLILREVKCVDDNAA